MNAITKIVSAFTLVILVGCLNNPVSKSPENENQASPLVIATRAGLEANLAKWRSANLAEYRILIQADRHFFPMGWMNISVLGTNPVQIDSVPGEDALFDPECPEKAPTIEYLFAKIESKLADTNWTVGVQYDLKYGYPKVLEIKYRGEVMDADMTFEVARFWPVQLQP